MTEAEASEIVVTPEMLTVGYRAYAEASFVEPGTVDESDGLEAAFPEMLKVWVAQGSPVSREPRRS